MRDLDECRAYYWAYGAAGVLRRWRRPGGEDGLLLELLDYVHKNFPAVERIAAYGTTKDVLKIGGRSEGPGSSGTGQLIYLGS